MRKALLSVGGLIALGALLVGPDPFVDVQENTWEGKLVDWNCKQLQVADPCPVSLDTESFGISVGGGILLNLDGRGSALARERLGESGRSGNVPAVIIGVRNGRNLAVESLELVASESPISD